MQSSEESLKFEETSGEQGERMSSMILIMILLPSTTIVHYWIGVKYFICFGDERRDSHISFI